MAEWQADSPLYDLVILGGFRLAPSGSTYIESSGSMHQRTLKETSLNKINCYIT